jgi:ferredoxin
MIPKKKKKILIDIHICSGCGACVKTCPLKVVKPVGKNLIILKGCNYCLACLEVCPTGAITNASN